MIRFSRILFPVDLSRASSELFILHVLEPRLSYYPIPAAASDVIMMPTHGHGPFRRLTLGSVTARILHSATCPVWTGVHTDQMWSHTGAGRHRFLCAVDADQRGRPVAEMGAPVHM